MHPVIHERKEAAGATQMGNAEETNELVGKTGSGNTLASAAKDVSDLWKEAFAAAQRGFLGQGGAKSLYFSDVKGGKHLPQIFI